MSTWTDVKNQILQKLPDAGINVISPLKLRESLYAIIDQVIASTPDPVEFEWKATDGSGNSVTYNIGDPVIDDNRWFIAIAQNTNKKPVLPDGSINVDFWREENASTTRYIDNWEAKLYTYSVEIVLHNKKLYLLDRTVVGTAPFLSEDIDTEITANQWYDLSPDSGGGGIDPANIVNDFSTDPNDANKVAGANAVYNLFQILASNDVDYDTLQEIVDFIKTIDTDGELVAAVDTAVGNTKWRTGNPDITANTNLGATPIIDLSLGDVIKKTMNVSVTELSFTNGVEGKTYQLYVTIDATGGYDFIYTTATIETQSDIPLIMPSDEPGETHLYQITPIIRDAVTYYKVTPIYNY